jgi:hypothetical protein
MNRLTKVESSSVLIKDGWKKKDTESYTSICYGCEEIGKCVNKCGFYKALEKLAAYEDTGFEPEEVKQLNASDVSKEESSIKYYNEMRKYRDELKYYKDLEKQLIDKYNELKNKIDGDGVENYTNGYKYGHRNGQIELLEWILKIDTGCREEAEKALE